jgi:hypothetical protein
VLLEPPAKVSLEEAPPVLELPPVLVGAPPTPVAPPVLTVPPLLEAPAALLAPPMLGADAPPCPMLVEVSADEPPIGISQFNAFVQSFACSEQPRQQKTTRQQSVLLAGVCIVALPQRA